MKIAPTACFALALAGLLLLQPDCRAEKASKAAPTKPQETKDKVSYSIGADIGNSLKRSDLDVNPDFLAQGLKDALVGKTVMTDEEMKTTLEAFKGDMQAKMMAKQKAAAEKNKADADKFLEENKKKDGVVTTASGLQYKIIKEGTGPKAKASDTVSVNYKGSLINGKVFDENKDGPVTFPVEGLIPAWSEALQMMPVGSKWQLVVPPSLAYGENAPPVIGPNQALVFEVELLEIKKPEQKEAAEGAKPAPSATATTPAAPEPAKAK